MKKIKSAMLILMVAIGFASFVSCGNNKNAQPNDGTSTLTIVDPAKFWNASPYLVIQL